MTSNASNLARSLLIYALALPIALSVGIIVVHNTDFRYWYALGLILALIAFPLVVKWHRPLLFMSWNTTIMLFFFPGHPFLWLFAAFLSLLVCLVQRTLVRDMRFIHAPSVLLPLLYLSVVIFATGLLTGGFGLRIFGSSKVGGKGYWMLLGGVAGFLAMLAQRIPPEKVLLYLRLFFLSSLTNGIGYAINFIGPSLWYIFLVFPVDAMPTEGGSSAIARYGGLSVGLLGAFWYLLARYGILDLLDKKQFGKMFLLLCVVVLTLGGGYRTNLILMGLTLLVLGYLEGLFRSKYAPLVTFSALGAFALLVLFADKLPLPIQRSLAVLPIRVDPLARLEAERSSEWRLDMWRMLLPEIPRYLWLGKGLEVSVTELDVSNDLSKTGFGSVTESSIVAGNYHNGPLTVLIPFGIWGGLGWLWFLAASLRALHYNHRYGDEMLRKLNALLLALFVAKTTLFMVVFGDFRVELPMFVGIVGFSLALNGGIRKPVRMRAPLVPIRVRSQPPAKLFTEPSHSA
jgi:hypothetical protein